MKTDTLQITLELLNLLSEVDEFKGASGATWRRSLYMVRPAVTTIEPAQTRSSRQKKAKR